MTTPADATPPTAADPLDVLTPEEREFVMSAETDEHGPGARLGRIVRDLCERLASAERAKADAEQCVANIREIVGHSINSSKPLEVVLDEIVRAKADAEARLAKVRAAIAERNCASDGLEMSILLDEFAAALGGTDAGGGEREARC